MDKDEAIRQISLTREQVKALGSFDGRAELLRKLNQLSDMVIRYKPYADYNKMCAREAEMIFNEKKRELDLLREGVL